MGSFGGVVLLQFTVGNYLSFKSKATLSMLALPSAAGDQDARVLSVEGMPPVVRTAAVYGANASGKSNLVEALRIARELVRRGTRPDEPVEVTSFKLDPSLADEPSSFEFELACGSKRYSYGFLVTRSRVEQEWLDTGLHGETRLFTREHDSNSPERPKILVEPTLAGSPERHQFIDFVAAGTRPNQLFLTEAAERNVAELEDLVGWFGSGLRIIGPMIERGGSVLRAMEKDEGLREFLGRFLREAGTGVASVGVRPNPALEALLTLESSGEPQTPFERMRRIARRAAIRETEIVLTHESSAGPAVDFELVEESDGTRRLLSLAPEIYRLREEGRDTTVVADELDRSLHTLMSRFVVRAFNEASATNHSQLIFTTHDTNLLDLTLLRRESIWFVEKDAGGASHLYSLAEFDAEQVNALQSAVERGYLQGRFGAVPFLGDPQRLGWTAAKTKR